jgi:hypothetical protein
MVADTPAWSTVNDREQRGENRRRIYGHAEPETGPVRGTVLLPPESVPDAAHLGCVEGHFSAGSSDTLEMRTVFQLLRELGNGKRIEHHAALKLAVHGQGFAGVFLAEYAPVPVVLSLLEEPTGHTPSQFQLGLESGLLRMRNLMAVPAYPRRWTDEEFRQVLVRMGGWAIAGLLLPDPPRDAWPWLWDAGSILHDVNELGVPEATRERLALRRPDLADWLRGGPGVWTVTSNTTLLRDLNVKRDCDDKGVLSPSFEFIIRGY